jgi:hypothetical protein
LPPGVRAGHIVRVLLLSRPCPLLLLFATSPRASILDSRSGCKLLGLWRLLLLLALLLELHLGLLLWVPPLVL